MQRKKVCRRLAIGVLCALGSSAVATAAEPARQAIPSATSLTFSKDIAPLLYEHCAACHRPGGSGPFPLLTYQDARVRARQVAAVVARRSMPPWKPEPGHGEFVGARRLSEDQIARIVTWVQQGSLEGRPADLPALPRSSDEWQLGPPDVVLRTDRPFRLPPGGPDRMRSFVVPGPAGTDRYIRAWEFRTNAPQVVHHATVVIDPTRTSRRLDEQDPEPGYDGLIPFSAQNPEGYFLGWTPGQSPSLSPDDMAWRLPAGSDVVFMLHLRPGTQTESIEASVGLYFAEAPAARVPAMVRLNRQDLDIPPGEAHYVASDRYVLPVDVHAYSVQPHAHNLLREVRASATLPDGTRRSLLYIKDWDFHWQDVYRYRQPEFLPAGTVLQMEMVYDNSAANRANPHTPPRRVTYGQRTSDEMGDLWIQVVPRQPSDLSALTQSLRRKLLPQNIQGYRMMIASDPENVSLHDDLALLLIEGGDLIAAGAEFRQSLRLRPEIAATHYNLGYLLLGLRQVDEAKALFRAALERDPEYGPAHTGLGIALEAEGRLDEAAAHFSAAASVLPTAEVYSLLGSVRQKQEQFDAALAAHRDALRLSPAHADAHYGSGLALASLGRSREAVESFRRALAVQPDWMAARLALAWVLATAADESVRNPSEAVALADAARTADGVQRVHLLDARAAALAASGRFAEASASAQEALGELAADEQPVLQAAIRARLALYLSGVPYRPPAR